MCARADLQNQQSEGRQKPVPRIHQLHQPHGNYRKASRTVYGAAEAKQEEMRLKYELGERTAAKSLTLHYYTAEQFKQFIAAAADCILFATAFL